MTMSHKGALQKAWEAYFDAQPNDTDEYGGIEAAIRAYLDARRLVMAPKVATAEMAEAVAFGDYTTFSYGGDTNSFDFFSAENAKSVWVDMLAAAPDPFKEASE